MLVDNIKLNPPIQYSLIWLMIGCVLVLSIIVWIAAVFMITRKKRPRTLAQLQPAPDDFDLDRLKSRYLKLVDECYVSYMHERTTLKGLHRGLSMTVRYFVFEARYYPAPRLTLADLKKAQLPHLSKIIEEYYAKEFSSVEKGSAENATEAAKEFIRSWV